MARAGLSMVPLGESVALYDDVGGALIMLNAGAATVWDCCDGLTRFEDIVEALMQAHVVTGDSIREDVRRTLRKLSSLGLVIEARSDVSVPGPGTGGSPAPGASSKAL
jgi:hypothetical protein